MSWAKVVVGDVPPSFLGKEPTGESVELSEMKGKVVVATFWASWCAPCLKEMDVLEGIQTQVGKDKLEVVAINFKEGKRTYNKIRKKLKNLSITMTHDRRGKISKTYDVNSVPHMFIINKSGFVAHIHRGYGEGMIPILVDELNKLLLE